MLCFVRAQSPLRHHLELQESSKKPAKLTAWRVFCFLRLQRSPTTFFGLYTKDGSTPKTGASPFNGQFLGLHQRQGQAPSTGSSSDRFLINSPADSPADFPAILSDHEIKALRVSTASISSASTAVCSTGCVKRRGSRQSTAFDHTSPTANYLITVWTSTRHIWHKFLPYM